jgi:hypothetical protein
MLILKASALLFNFVIEDRREPGFLLALFGSSQWRIAREQDAPFFGVATRLNRRRAGVELDVRLCTFAGV